MRARLATIVLALAASCTTSSDGDEQTFKDTSGRVCSVDIATAAMLATCNVAPPATTCAQGASPAFELTLDVETSGGTTVSTPSICEVCSDASASMSFVVSGTCSPLACTTQSDCFFMTSSCTNGVCGPV